MLNTLLLQGPVGPLFRGLARELRRRGDRVWHLTFNGGDEFFADRQSVVRYARGADEWPFYLSSLIHSQRIDRVFLFGDCRPLHRIAQLVCAQLGVPVFVVEEGYLRPFYLTVEAGGVNGNSRLPRDPRFYLDSVVPREVEPRSYRWVFTRRVFACIAYYLMLALKRRRYPNYQHYRSDNLVREGLAWVRAGWRKRLYAFKERRTLRRLQDRGFYLVPLQVEGDTQLTYHSDYDSVPGFIAQVIASFAAHAPRATELVIKHHPMDRGYNDYGWLIRDLARQHGVAGRVRYIHDVSLPALLRKARGVVVINSTVGLSALHHGTPTIALGEAIYDLPGLTCQDGLDDFWARPGKVDARLFRRYRAYLVRYTQLNGTSATTDADWSMLDRVPGFVPGAAQADVVPPAQQAVGAVADDAADENRTASGRLIIAADEFRRQTSPAEETTSGVPSA